MVPAFLASGYHVNTDLPARVAESGHASVTITPALGPDPVLAEIMRGRLLEVGWSPGDAVVMAAAGSSDPAARRELAHAAALLGELVGEVHLGFVATGVPTVADIVRRLRRSGRRVFIASYLLAPGVFHTKLGQLRRARGDRAAGRAPRSGGAAGPSLHAPRSAYAGPHATDWRYELSTSDKAHPQVELQDGTTQRRVRGPRDLRRREGHLVAARGRGLAGLRRYQQKTDRRSRCSCSARFTDWPCKVAPLSGVRRSEPAPIVSAAIRG